MSVNIFLITYDKAKIATIKYGKIKLEEAGYNILILFVLKADLKANIYKPGTLEVEAEKFQVQRNSMICLS